METQLEITEKDLKKSQKNWKDLTNKELFDKFRSGTEPSFPKFLDTLILKEQDETENNPRHQTGKTNSRQ